MGEHSEQSRYAAELLEAVRHRLKITDNPLDFSPFDSEGETGSIIRHAAHVALDSVDSRIQRNFRDEFHVGYVEYRMMAILSAAMGVIGIAGQFNEGILMAGAVLGFLFFIPFAIAFFNARNHRNAAEKLYRDFATALGIRPVDRF